MHGDRRVRRPQKPFTVEVKKVRKGGFARFLGAGPQWIGSDPAEDAPKEQPAPPQAAPPRAEPAPPRRILEAIAPLSEAPAADEAGSDATPETSPEPAGEIETKPRRRGRPPKVVTIAEGAESAVAPKVRVVPAPRKKSPTIKSRPEIERVPPVAAAPVFAPALAPVFAPEPTARVAQASRGEAANSLPRGERWKRRLPKVLW
jgi:hypothetical protein